MKKLYFLALLCSFSVIAFAQSTTVVLWATASGSSNGTTITPDAIITGASNTTRGYAVFDLSAIPAGSVIMSVSSGIDVNAYTAGAVPPTLWRVYGYISVPPFSSVLSSPSLFADMATGTGATLLYPTPWGTSPGDPSFPTNGGAVGYITGALPTGSASVSYLTTAAPPVGPYTTATYTITGASGISGAPADTALPGHAPYLVITYCAPPTAETASGPTTTLCAGTSSVTLTGSATGATTYSWTGPGSYTSTNASSTFFATAASSGVYTLTAVNVCGTTSASTTATTAPVTVEGGPISGITNVWVGFTTDLSDPTLGGTWSSSNTGVAIVDPSSGIVTGESPGTVTITYTTASGCVYTASVLVIASVFSQIPTIAGGSGGLGFPIQAWFPFCGDTTDRDQLVGAGPNPLINSGGGVVPATLTTDRFGIINDAYYFDGVDNVMYTPTFFAINPVTNDYTYSCWMEADTIQNSIIIYNGTPSSDGYGFVMNNGVTPFATGAGNYVAVLFGGVQQFLPTAVSLNRWHNLVLKKVGNSYNFYIDDVSVGFFISPFNGLNGVFSVGGDATSVPAAGPIGTTGPLQYPFRGKIDDIALYNQEITDAERDSLYNFNPDARPFVLGADTAICTDSITLTPNPTSQGNYYLWTYTTPLGIDTVDIPGTVIPNTDSTVVVSPSSLITGTLYKLAVGKSFGCFAYDSVRVYKTPIPVNIGASRRNICIGDTITLTDIIPHSPSSTFIWSTGDTANSITVYAAGTYSVTIDSVDHYTRTIGGVIYNDSVTCLGSATVVVNAYSPPIIGVSNSYTSCTGVPDTIRPYLDSMYSYTWGKGLGTPPLYTAADSVDTLIADSIGLTVYWLEVTDVGCTVFDTISVFIAFDTFTFFAHDTAICLGQSLLPGPGNELVTINDNATYQWTPTAGIPASNTPNPHISPDTSAEYILTVSYPHCPDLKDSFYLDVQPNPIVYPGNNRSICQFDTIHIAANASPAWYTHYIYAWSPSTELDASTTSTVVFTAADTGQVSLVIAVSTPAGCSSTDSVQLFVHPGNFLLGSLDTILCPDDSIQLTPYVDPNYPGTTISSYNWSPSTYLSDSTAAAPWVKAVTSLGYTLIAKSQYGCADTIKYTITVPAAAVINLGPDSVSIFPGESYVISTQTNCVNFVWYPPLQINNIYISSPIVTPNANTTYIVHASTEYGCPTVDSIRVKISQKDSIYVPNAFTPGSATNSLFSIASIGAVGDVSLLYFRIYNRWGNMVFETKNINQGWDGTYNGKPQPQGVYVFEIEAESVDGEVFQRQGNVTLLR